MSIRTGDQTEAFVSADGSPLAPYLATLAGDAPALIHRTIDEAGT